MGGERDCNLHKERIMIAEIELSTLALSIVFIACIIGLMSVLHAECKDAL